MCVLVVGALAKVLTLLRSADAMWKMKGANSLRDTRWSWSASDAATRGEWGCRHMKGGVDWCMRSGFHVCSSSTVARAASTCHTELWPQAAHATLAHTHQCMKGRNTDPMPWRTMPFINHVPACKEQPPPHSFPSEWVDTRTNASKMDSLHSHSMNICTCSSVASTPLLASTLAMSAADSLPSLSVSNWWRVCGREGGSIEDRLKKLSCNSGSQH